MKTETQDGDPRLLNSVEIPPEVADALMEQVILPRLVEEYLDIAEKMEEAAPGGVV